MAPAAETRLWPALAQDAWPVLSGTLRAQILVIGAGVTGLSAALHAAEAGFDVVVMERHGIGWGASGQSGGLVVPGLPLPMARLQRLFGKAGAQECAQTFASAPDVVFSLIERHGIHCDAVRGGCLMLSQASRGERALHAEPGAPQIVLDAAAAEARSGSPYYAGGVLDRRGGSLHPVKFLTGLAEAARARGVRIYTGSPATRLSRAHFGWYVESPEGSVSTRTVVLAANAHSDALWTGLNRSFIKLPVLQIATDPLPEAVRQTILPGGVVLYDTHASARHIRLDPQGRLIFGMRGAFTKAALVRAEAAARRIFPQLGDVAFPYAWGGHLAAMPDHVPHIHDLAPALLAGLGYQWRGLSMGTMLGSILARWATGAPRDSLGFPVTKLKPMEFPELAAFSAALRLQYANMRG